MSSLLQARFLLAHFCLLFPVKHRIPDRRVLKSLLREAREGKHELALSAHGTAVYL